MRYRAALALLASALLLYGYRYWLGAHQLFINAHVITLDESRPFAQALEIAHGRIQFVGSSQEVLSRARWYSRVTDFGGRTLLPGFVDAHSHFLATGLAAVTIDLNPPPGGDVGTLDDLYARLEEEIAQRGENDWIIGFNYDNTVFPSGRHPDKRALDALSERHRIYLRHNSGHMGVANSAALQELLQLPELAGGTSTLGLEHLIGRYPNSSEPNGLLQERAAPSLAHFVSQFSLLDYIRILRRARLAYVSQGFTTVQNGLTGRADLRLLRWLSRLGILSLRVMVWASHLALEQDVLSSDLTPESLSSDSFRVSAIKLIADGSPQGYTAYLSAPYHVPPAADPAYRGQAEFGRSRLAALIRQYIELGWTVAVHANGDAAVDDVLRALESMPAFKRDATRANVILVHAQTIRLDQLPRLKALGVTPSYFPAHTYYWGDWHRERTLGPVRAANISPLFSTDRLGIRYSIHTDAPVTQPLSMQLLWSATERLTSSGQSLGPAQRITRESALRSMTIDAAWQNGVDANVGSLQAGKFADIVELSDDPLTVEDVRQVQILGTFIAGEAVYRLPLEN